jgi:hypothetical protein
LLSLFFGKRWSSFPITAITRDHGDHPIGDATWSPFGKSQIINPAQPEARLLPVAYF